MADSPLRRLLHRWFVEYNPLYLLSAMLVLVGTLGFSRGLAVGEDVAGFLAVAGIAELYSLALLGGAALLMRLGHRRSAVMLGLLTVLYQGDLTLHTETCVNLGTIGVVASASWLALFAGKLFAASRIFDLRLSRATWLTAIGGATGLALLPYLLPFLDTRWQPAVVGGWLFVLVHGQRFAHVGAKVDRDAWGATVERRSVVATWSIWSVLLLLHVGFWSMHHRFTLASLFPVVPFLAARWVRREGRLHALVSSALVLVALRTPESFAWTALLASMTLALRGWLAPREPASELRTGPGAAPEGPYRALEGAVQANVERLVFVDPRPAARRLLVVAAIALYLSMWTVTWTGGHWPEHVFALDLVFTAGAVLAVWRTRARFVAIPTLGAWTHAALVAHLVPAPSTPMEWGATAIGLGFFLLFGSLGASYALRTKPSPQPDPAEHT